VTQFEALSRHLYGGTEEMLQIPQWGYPVYDFEKKTSWNRT